MTTLVQATGVSWQTNGARLVEDVDLEARAGEVTAIVGPNGAGKTTLLRLLAGELTPCTGEVSICGQLVSKTRRETLALRRSVLPQQTTLRFPFTCLQVVLMGRWPHMRGGGRESVDDIAIAESSLLRVDAFHLRDRPFPSLSIGEQARVCLARVLAQDTPVIFLDEPTAALDIHHQHRVMRLARELADEGRAVVVILHDLNLAAAVDKIAVMRSGRIVTCGPPACVLCPETLSSVFGHPVSVIAGEDGLPLVMARRV